jgi:hypothetical protein
VSELTFASVDFIGAKLRGALLGCLPGEQLARLRLPIAGHAPAHGEF